MTNDAMSNSMVRERLEVALRAKEVTDRAGLLPMQVRAVGIAGSAWGRRSLCDLCRVMGEYWRDRSL